MMSFPNFIRDTQQSSKPMESAFPPFKTEHKYKGVYERAGFEVYRPPSSANSDGHSIRSGGSSSSRKTHHHHHQQQTMTHHQSLPGFQQHSKQNYPPGNNYKPMASSSTSSLSSRKSSPPRSSTFSKFNYNKSTSSISTNTPTRPSNEYVHYKSQPDIKSPAYRAVSEPHYSQNPRSADKLTQQPHHLHVPYQQQQQVPQQQVPQQALRQSHDDYNQRRMLSAPLQEYPRRESEPSHHRSDNFSTNPYQSINNNNNSNNFNNNNAYPQHQHQQYQQQYQPQPIKEALDDQQAIDYNSSQSATKNIKNLKLDLQDQSNYHPVLQQHHSPKSLNSTQSGNTTNTQTRPSRSPEQNPSSMSRIESQPRSKSPSGASTRVGSNISPKARNGYGTPSMAFAGYHHPEVHQVGSPNLNKSPKFMVSPVPGLPSSPSHPDLQGVSRDDKLKTALESLYMDHAKSKKVENDTYLQPDQQQRQRQQSSEGYNPYSSGESYESNHLRKHSAQDTTASSLSTTIPTDYSYHEPGTTSNKVPSLYSFEQGSSGYSQDERSSLGRTIHQFEQTANPSPSYTYAPEDTLSPATNNHYLDDASLSSSHYLHHLNPDASGGRGRMSQLSMVSSIISNDLKVSNNHTDDEDRNEEDEEIDRELERQLASMKLGPVDEHSSKHSSKHSDIQPIMAHSPKRSVIPEVKIDLAASPEQVRQPQVIPEFKIEEEIQEETGMPAEEEDLNDDLNSIESTPPLSISHSSQHSSQLKSDTEKPQDTKPATLDDSVPPLQPKNHSIEQELKRMNFEIKPTDESPSMYINTNAVDNLISPNVISFPPDTPESAASFNNPAPAGTGPCRGCFFEIEPKAKGSNKAIFSTTGELSGQWHRKCFKCSFLNCDLHFSKHIPCYVISDNPYCNQHYHMLNHTMCENCMEGIEGEAIENEEGQMWHLDCLRCTVCRDVISNDYFLIDGAIVCEADVNKVTRTGNDIQKRRTRIYHV
ncbi:Paxillin-like protein 1 [Spathaspora sp. JA1]|nr:Paxillin-like protein 1 [Spathaspora sp. JA1]